MSGKAVPPDPSRQLEASLRERMGLEMTLSVGLSGKQATENGSRVMSADPLEVEQAVRIALTHNATLRARLEELGLAAADLRQAKLFSNPEGHLEYRNPSGGGAQGTGREFGVTQDFLSVLARPLRKRMAGAKLEQVQLLLGHEVLDLAVQVKIAHCALQAALARLELRKQVVGSLKTGLDLAGRQHQAGNISDRDLARYRLAYHEALLELSHDEGETMVSRERLSFLMGIQDQAGWTVTPVVPDLPPSDPVPGDLEAVALASRWDLLAVRREPTILASALELSKLNILSGLKLGVDSEKDFDGAIGVGPAFEFTVPIFDRRQAANARLRTEKRQSRLAIEALEQQIRFEVRSTWARLSTSRKVAHCYAAEVVPLHKILAQETLLRYNYMLEGVYEVLRARAEELEAKRRFIDAAKNYWIILAELERAVGGRLPQPARPPHDTPGPRDAPQERALQSQGHLHGGGQHR